MNLHEIFLSKNPTVANIQYVVSKSYSPFSTEEELNIIADYCFLNLRSNTARCMLYNIAHNPAADEDLSLKIIAFFFARYKR